MDRYIDRYRCIYVCVCVRERVCECGRSRASCGVRRPKPSSG